MRYENWISFRYLTAKKDRFLSVIHFVSILGIAIGVMALIIVIGVMSGFDRDIREKIIGTNAHVIVEKEIGLSNYHETQEELKNIEGIKGATPYINGSVFLESRHRSVSLILRGIDPRTEGDVTKAREYLVKGSLDDLTRGTVIIGSQLAAYSGYDVGDTIKVIAPASGLSGREWKYPLEIVGIFNSGMFDYDMNLVLTNLAQAQEIYNFDPGVVGGIAIKLDKIDEAKEVKDKIYDKIGYSFLVRTWIEQNYNFFAALKLEKFAMFIILTLIVLVAALNIVSTLIVTVTSRVKDVGILKAVGVPNNAILKIFTIEGVSIGIIGTFWGLIGGIGLSIALKKFQFIKLPQEVYYIDRLPVLLNLSDLLIITGASILISYLATIYPAIKAARLDPVDALRYE